MEKSIDDKITKLDKYASKVEQALQTITLQAQGGDLEPFTEQEIRMHLSRDPEMIADAGLFLAKIQRAYESAKLNTSIVNAELWKICNEERDSLGLTNAKDRESWVKTQPKYIQCAKEEIEWKYQLERMKVIYDRYENLFYGTRKLCSLIEKDNQNIYRREKYEGYE